MKVFFPLTTFLLSAAFCHGAGLRQGSRRTAIKRSLPMNYFDVLKTMIPEFDGGCSIALSGNTKVSCSRPGFTADLTAQGSVDQSLLTLKTTQLQSGGNSQTNSYSFNGSMSTRDILNDAFPNAPSPSGDYDESLFAMLTRFSGACSIKLVGGDSTEVSCSEGGFTAELTAKGATDQEPTELKTCVIVGGGNTSCSTYNYNGSQTTAQILQEALGSSS